MIFCALIGIYSCQPALVNFPKLPDCPKPKQLDCPAQKNTDVLPTFPENMVLSIESGRIVQMDDNGANFVKMYHELRKSGKGLCPG